MLTSEQQRKKPKRSKIRYTEYYDLQDTFDRLYVDSVNGKVFTNLVSLMSSEKNIKLAYRSIKRNTGSMTSGVDGRTISDFAKLSEHGYVTLIQRKFNCYHPNAVRRVEIPKENGKMRPLGIPTMVDRLVQQCVKQVMEPICEAKFYDHSYGFRPDRSAENAIARCNQIMQLCHMHYVVDIDVKSFFDNVCHEKLIRQVWYLGIHDKKLLCIIREMLKAPIILPNGEIQHPDKGTPQGGILSPLLSNIVLNELDWWIASQWELMPTHNNIKEQFSPIGSRIRSNKYRGLRCGKLKEMFIVRYADDFKIFCRKRSDALKVFDATKLWLKERLGLDISPEKSKVVNLKRQYSDFLGIKLKVFKRCKSWVVKSHICDKAMKRLKIDLTGKVKAIQHISDERRQFYAIMRFNASVLGMHNYYRMATRVGEDFRKINFPLMITMHCRLKGLSKEGKLDKSSIWKQYGRSRQVRYLHGHPLVPIAYICHSKALSKKRSINRYTPAGRAEKHINLEIDTEVMLWLMRNPTQDGTIEYADNRISLFAGQYGRCSVTGEKLMPHFTHCHHIMPLAVGGMDEYANLTLVTTDVHTLIHAVHMETILQYMEKLRLDASQLVKLNKLRKQVSLPPIAA